MRAQILTKLKVADEVWIAGPPSPRTPQAPDFSIEEIVDRARREGYTNLCVPVFMFMLCSIALQSPPNPGRYRMLFETSEGRRRLFRIGDTYHPTERRERLFQTWRPSPAVRGLLGWYDDWSRTSASDSDESDPLLRLRGTGATCGGRNAR